MTGSTINSAASLIPGTTSATGSGTASSTSALSSLSSNFGDFLNLLMTQLKNQDPTTPLDANSFTQELVQFSGVEQQINTNTSLSTLIQLTQAGEVEQSANLVGKQVVVNSSQLALQNGTGGIQFNSAGAQPVEIAVYSTSGVKVSDNFLNAHTGINSWSWNGQDSSGNQLPDGTYTVGVVGGGSGTSSATPLTFSVVGKATGVVSSGNNVTLELGSLSVPFSAVQQVLSGS